jgi:predicted TIM-barrel fold metal-dependent hydrolase
VDKIDDANRWRISSPGSKGWEHSPAPGAKNKYLMISCDTHANEPHDLFKKRLDKKFEERLPRVQVDADGRKWHLIEGMEPARWVQESGLEGEDLERSARPADVAGRLADQDRDGVDAEIIFPNKFLGLFATRDPEFLYAQARTYNDWAWETFSAVNDRLAPMACIPAVDVNAAIAEVERVAKLGFRGLTLSVKATYGANSAKDKAYNWPEYDALWAAIQDSGLPATFHVGTGKDPRTTRGAGGAVTNYVVHAMTPSVEVMAIFCSSGILERFPKLNVVTVEAGIGWVPWTGHAMDEAYKKHHMWSFPKLKTLPSDYLKMQCFATFQEDPAGLAAGVEMGYANCFLWANDYPHHEGSWPHSCEAIERQMGKLSEHHRRLILGETGARLFGFETKRTSAA